MPQLQPRELKKRSDAAWLLRDQWRTILIDAYEMAMAGRNPYSGNDKAPRPMDRQFDSTAPISTIKLANRILMDLTPPDQNWIDVKPGPLLELQYSKEDLEQLRPKLDGVAKIGNMVINSGNAVNVRYEAFIDMLVGGMGVALALEDATDDLEPIIEQAVSQAEVAIDENAKGRISGIFRRRKIKLNKITEIWDDAKIPENLTNQKGKDKDPEIEVLETTYEGGAKSNVAWYYDVLICQNDAEPVRIVERTYEICPWTIWRWMKLPGIPYGPGPVILALADIRTANKIMEMILKNASLALAGMYLARDDGVLNPDNVLITPGGIIPVQATGGSLGASLAPLGTNREFDVGQIMLDKMQTTIKKHLFDNSLPPDRATPASATEIIQRVKELTSDIGGGTGRLQADTTQYVRRRLEILAKRGLIPNLKIDQFTLKVQINAPLARAAQHAEIETVIQWYQLCISLGGPQAAMLVGKIEAILMWAAEKMGVPNELLRTKSEQAELQKNVATIVAAQQSQQATASMPAQAA
jgi:hypothetical protein